MTIKVKRFVVYKYMSILIQDETRTTIVHRSGAISKFLTSNDLQGQKFRWIEA